jgi:transcriptional regulator with XRE-family HTH domain
MIMAHGPKSRGLKALYDRYVGTDPEKVDAFEAAMSNAEVARSIYRLRTNAHMTQQALAALVGTAPSVICRLEDADYDGHSLSMLRRIAAALGRRVEIRFKPESAARPLMKTAKAVSKAPSAGAAHAKKAAATKAVSKTPSAGAAHAKKAAASKSKLIRGKKERIKTS